MNFKLLFGAGFGKKNPSQTTHKNHIGVFFLPLDYGNCHVFRLPMWEKCEDTKCPQPILPGLPHHTRPALEGINFIAVMFSGIPERPEI